MLYVLLQREQRNRWRAILQSDVASQRRSEICVSALDGHCAASFYPTCAPANTNPQNPKETLSSFFHSLPFFDPLWWHWLILTLLIEIEWNWGHWRRLAKEVATPGGSPKRSWKSPWKYKMIQDVQSAVYAQIVAKVLTKCKSTAANSSSGSESL